MQLRGSRNRDNPWLLCQQSSQCDVSGRSAFALGHRLTTLTSAITIRLPTYGGIFAWEFEKKEEELKVRVEGQLVFNNIAMRLDAALKGLGLAYMPEDLVQSHVAKGRLIRLLSDWCPSFPGYHLYYPSRRQSSPAFTLFRDALRYAG